MIRIPLAVALSFVIAPVFAQSSVPAESAKPASEAAPAAPATPALPPGMKQYWFVMLKRGSKRDQSAEEAKQLQAGHMANMQAYATMGKLQIAGPFMDDGDWRGIFILDVRRRSHVQRRPCGEGRPPGLRNQALAVAGGRDVEVANAGTRARRTAVESATSDCGCTARCRKGRRASSVSARRITPGATASCQACVFRRPEFRRKGAGGHACRVADTEYAGRRHRTRA